MGCPRVVPTFKKFMCSKFRSLFLALTSEMGECPPHPHPPHPTHKAKYEQISGQHMTQNALKQGTLDSFAAMFQFIFLPCVWVGVSKWFLNTVPWKTGMLIYLPVTSRPLIFLQKEAVLSPCHFATTHLTACVLNFCLPWTSRPMEWRTLSHRLIEGLNPRLLE